MKCDQFTVQLSLGNERCSSAASSAGNSTAHEIVRAQPPEDLLQKRLENGVYRYEDAELMKRCSKCQDHWPADTEFFYTAKEERDGLAKWCKACYQEWRYAKDRLRKNVADTAQTGMKS